MPLLLLLLPTKAPVLCLHRTPLCRGQVSNPGTAPLQPGTVRGRGTAKPRHLAPAPAPARAEGLGGARSRRSEPLPPHLRRAGTRAGPGLPPTPRRGRRQRGAGRGGAARPRRAWERSGAGGSGGGGAALSCPHTHTDTDTAQPSGSRQHGRAGGGAARRRAARLAPRGPALPLGRRRCRSPPVPPPPPPGPGPAPAPAAAAPRREDEVSAGGDVPGRAAAELRGDRCARGGVTPWGWGFPVRVEGGGEVKQCGAS